MAGQTNLLCKTEKEKKLRHLVQMAEEIKLIN